MNLSYTCKMQTDQECRGEMEGSGRKTDSEKEKGKFIDLSVMVMNADKPTPWITFLSQSPLITVFLVKTNPLASEHLQSASMFTTNS